ncbi:hypothetical protein B0T11DRAFT_328432 [Plectosphaerella cucumerina]|uniref:Uncharacterized protein n=1 Tax=Plectosphaerella cucumerina TaxID=40658 RepID=A0A8K0TH34_9PEZI|nr:hypothetical protein B0T11DRAFT_328432 [Plectosphaerella cucumerina]
MGLFKKDKPSFLPNLETHAGRARGASGKLNYWDIKNSSAEPFADISKAVIAELAESGLPRSSTIYFNFYLCGETISSAHVSVMVTGAPEDQRKKAVKHLKKSPVVTNYPGIKIDHWEGPPVVRQ